MKISVNNMNYKSAYSLRPQPPLGLDNKRKVYSFIRKVVSALFRKCFMSQVLSHHHQSSEQHTLAETHKSYVMCYINALASAMELFQSRVFLFISLIRTRNLH